MNGLKVRMKYLDVDDCGEDVSERLAAAGLPDGHEIVPAECDGPSLRLDRHWTLEALLLQKSDFLFLFASNRPAQKSEPSNRILSLSERIILSSSLK